MQEARIVEDIGRRWEQMLTDYAGKHHLRRVANEYGDVDTDDFIISEEIATNKLEQLDEESSGIPVLEWWDNFPDSTWRCKSKRLSADWFPTLNLEIEDALAFLAIGECRIAIDYKPISLAIRSHKRARDFVKDNALLPQPVDANAWTEERGSEGQERIMYNSNWRFAIKLAPINVSTLLRKTKFVSLPEVCPTLAGACLCYLGICDRLAHLPLNTRRELARGSRGK